MNMYEFSLTPGLMEPRCWQRSFMFTRNQTGKEIQIQPIRTLLVSSVAFQNSLTTHSQYSEASTKVFQAWTLSTDLALGSALCVLYHGSAKLPSFWKSSPTVKVTKVYRSLFSDKHARDDFLISDSEGEQVDDALKPSYAIRDRHLVKLKERQNDLRRRYDWTRIFENVFPAFDPTNQQISETSSRSEPTISMNEMIMSLNKCLDQAKDSDGITLTPL
jgi:hypothetical protein